MSPANGEAAAARWIGRFFQPSPPAIARRGSGARAPPQPVVGFDHTEQVLAGFDVPGEEQVVAVGQSVPADDARGRGRAEGKELLAVGLRDDVNLRLGGGEACHQVTPRRRRRNDDGVGEPCGSPDTQAEQRSPRPRMKLREVQACEVVHRHDPPPLPLRKDSGID